MKKYKKVDFSESIKDLTKLLLDTHNVKKKPNLDHYDYTGSQEIEHHSVTAVVSNIKESFTKDNLEYEKERGRNMLNVFISCAWRLGYSAAKIEGDDDIERESGHIAVDKVIEMLKKHTK